MNLSVAYLSRGRLLLLPNGQELKEVNSPFAEQTVQRRERARQNSSWQTQGLWGNFGEDGGMAAMMPATEQMAPRRPIRFAGLCAGNDPGQLFYLLDLHGVNGLFEYDTHTANELRLMHRNDFPARDLARHPETGHMAMCMPRQDGTVGIVVGENDGRFLRDLTTGDSLDECPSWHPGDANKLVFQSAGIGRDNSGAAIGLSPYRLEVAQLDSGDVSVLHEDETHDCLQPRLLADGTLYFIQRPYKPEGPQQRRTVVDDLKDIVLFPFRFLRGVYNFFNFFSTAFSGQPLMTAGGPKKQQSEQARFVQLRGHVIDLYKLKQGKKDTEPPALVPADWQLIRRSPDGNTEVVAEHVLAYDVDTQGHVILTDGRRITHVSPSGQKQRLWKDEMIEHVTIVPGQ